jgi:hypothetical protein
MSASEGKADIAYAQVHAVLCVHALIQTAAEVLWANAIPLVIASLVLIEFELVLIG